MDDQTPEPLPVSTLIRKRKTAANKYSLSQGELMLAELLARSMARDILAEQSKQLGENEEQD